MTLVIALIGYGAIAREVLRHLREEPGIAVSCGICRQGRESVAAAMFGDIPVVTEAEAVPKAVRLAVDCAGHPGLRAHGPVLLRRGIDVLTVSNGALADTTFALDLSEAAKAGGARLRLLPGAIGAVDILSAGAVGGLDRVVYTGRKPPAGWLGSAAEDVLDLDALTEATVHFEGTAREAALRYPKNANVAATVALAGIGMDETRVRLIADPAATANRHEIEASGAFGRFTFAVEGKALPGNPASSALTAMSVVRAVRARMAPVSP